MSEHRRIHGHPDAIAATGGRYYEDETWCTTETPAAFLQPQTGYENAARSVNSYANDDDDDETEYTYANEGEDYSVFHQGSFSPQHSQQAPAIATTCSRNRSAAAAAEAPYLYPPNDDVPRLPDDDTFADNDTVSSEEEVDRPTQQQKQQRGRQQQSTGNNIHTDDEDDEEHEEIAYTQSPPNDGLPPGITARDRAEDEAAMLRLLAHQLDHDWGTKADEDIDSQLRQFQGGGRAAGGGAAAAAAGTAGGGGGGGGGGAQPLTISPSLERRLRDFRFAQNKRIEKYGNERPWGILGLYDHLLGVRIDVEWSEDAAWRREHGEPYLSWADFEDSRNSGFNRPWFTYFILVVCTGVLIASIGVNGWKIEPMSVNPMIGPSAETLIKMGAKQTTLIVNAGEWYRLFSPMVLHAGLIHYLLNMLALWFIGSAVEQAHGYLSAAIIFVISAVGGNILSAIFLPEYISVGASGGIFGLIGACVADIAINWRLLFSKEVNKNDEGTRLRHLKVLLWLVFDILINCLIGLTPFVDNFTHLGGMVYGFLCGLSAIERLPVDFFGKAHNSCSRIRNYSVRFFGLILSVILIMVSTALLVESDGGTSPCSNCRYVSCVPFPFWADEDKKWWYCDDCDRVKGDVTKDETTGYYDVLTLSCPNGEIETIDLSGQDISDSDWLRNRLPMFCRQNCESLFA